MTDSEPLQSFIDLCLDPPGPSSLVAAFRSAIDALGFRYFACCSHVDLDNPPRQAIFVHNYPVGWVKHFLEARLDRIDPVLQLAQREPLPFFWDTALPAQPLTPAQKDMLAQASVYGLEHGYTVPIDLSWRPGCATASCSVVPQTPTSDPQHYVAVQTLANYLYAALQRISVPMRPAGPSLTERERQCLTLAAHGKDDWTIGKLLRISQYTVHAHIRQAMRRLHVTTRIQAIVLALHNGQIFLDDDSHSADQATVVPNSEDGPHLIR